MSGKIIGEVFQAGRTGGPYAHLNMTERFVLVAHAENAHDSDRTSRNLTAQTVATRTTLAPKTVRNALTALIRAGALVPLKDPSAGIGQDYLIPVPDHSTGTG